MTTEPERGEEGEHEIGADVQSPAGRRPWERRAPLPPHPDTETGTSRALRVRLGEIEANRAAELKRLRDELNGLERERNQIGPQPENDPKRDAAKQAVDGVAARIQAVVSEQRLEAHAAIEKALAHTTHPGVVLELAPGFGTMQTVNQGVEFVTRLLSASSKVNGATIRVEKAAKARREEYRRGRISVHPSAPPEAAVHELAHWVEELTPSVQSRVKSFFDRRTDGEKAQKLSKLDPLRKYRASETAKSDLFLEPYIGKIYRGGETEILSMGLEYLYRVPTWFAHNDPDHFDLIFQILKEN